jgi:hypothetical protein
MHDARTELGRNLHCAATKSTAKDESTVGLMETNCRSADIEIRIHFSLHSDDISTARTLTHIHSPQSKTYSALSHYTTHPLFPPYLISIITNASARHTHTHSLRSNTDIHKKKYALIPTPLHPSPAFKKKLTPRKCRPIFQCNYIRHVTKPKRKGSENARFVVETFPSTIYKA